MCYCTLNLYANPNGYQATFTYHNSRSSGGGNLNGLALDNVNLWLCGHNSSYSGRSSWLDGLTIGCLLGSLRSFLGQLLFSLKQK